MSYFVIFGPEFLETIVAFEISTLIFVKFNNFSKIASIWNKKCLLWFFLGKSFKPLLSYLKSAPSNLPNYKILQKNKSD